MGNVSPSLPTLPAELTSSSYVHLLKVQNRYSGQALYQQKDGPAAPCPVKASESTINISNRREATHKCPAACSCCEAGFLGYSITSNTATENDFPGSFLILQLNCL